MWTFFPIIPISFVLVVKAINTKNIQLFKVFHMFSHTLGKDCNTWSSVFYCKVETFSENLSMQPDLQSPGNTKSWSNYWKSIATIHIREKILLPSSCAGTALYLCCLYLFVHFTVDLGKRVICKLETIKKTVA